MNRERVNANISIALEAVFANQMRSLLTALGIIFGVAAVIAMMAIGSGAQQEILEQIKVVGVNNIVVEAVVADPKKDAENPEDEADKKEKKKKSPGLSLADARNIGRTVPGVESLSPEIVRQTTIMKNGVQRPAKLIGVRPDFFRIFDFELASGDFFSAEQLKAGAPVCIIGQDIKSRFFSKEDPIGKSVKIGNQWLRVVGVLKKRFLSDKMISDLGIRNYNLDVYTPLQSFLVRFNDRSKVSQKSIREARANRSRRQPVVAANYHQIDRLVVKIGQTEKVQATADLIGKILTRRHLDEVDFEVEVPELLLKQQQRTNTIFNIVLGAIAGISLIVGGIGIMNIMLASVMERIKEIGLRMALGAKKNDIIAQFLFEAVFISISGGVIGVVLGISAAKVISTMTDIPTIVSISSILISFGVATSVGLVFGIAPARKAALQDPITCLRYE